MTGLLEGGLAAYVPMPDLLPVAVRRNEMGDDVGRTHSKEELESTMDCLMEKKGSYAKLIAKLKPTGIVEPALKMMGEIN